MLKQNGLRFAARFEVITNGGTTSATKLSGSHALKIDRADSVVIIISYGTDYENDYSKKYRAGTDPADAVRSRGREAKEKGYDALRAEHIADYREIFDRVELDLGGKADEARAMEELYFQYGRYLLISSSRYGTLPANLQGVWNVYEKPPWQSDYHLNVNLQMNYWPANNTNMKETLSALVDYLDSLRKPGRITAHGIFGVGTGNMDEQTGWVINLSSNPYGFTGLVNPHNLINRQGGGYPHFSPECTAWMMQNLYNMYQYYPDESLLRDKIYPIMREAALFFSHQEVLVDDPVSGRKIMSPSYSSEHGPMWAGATFQQQLIWQLFTDVIEAAAILGVDETLRIKLSGLLLKLAPVPIGLSGPDGLTVIKEWWWEQSYGKTKGNIPIPDFDPEHRHLSHLAGLYPGNLITAENPENMAAAINSLNIRGDGATGWSRGMKTNLWARTGDGNRAYKIFSGLLTDATLPNMWDYHEGKYDPGTEIGIFQIDGNFGGTAGLAEMLLQSHAGYIHPLPALPDIWPHGRVKGLTARGGFVVDMAWSNGKLDALEVTSAAGLPCTVKTGEKFTKFNTEAGKKYDIAIFH
jgi:alpha-L-fucosidase 2